MISLFFIEIFITFFVTAVMSLIAYVWLSKLYRSIKVTRKQLLKTLIIALADVPITIIILILYNPEHTNISISNPLSYAWLLIFVSIGSFLIVFRNYLIYFNKKNFKRNNAR